MFTALIILFTIVFTGLAWVNLRTACFFILATLPLYLIRFAIGPLPLTLLELMLLAVILIWLIRHQGYKKLTTDFRIPIVIVLVAATVGIFVAPDTVAALGVWKSYFVEPILFFYILRSIIKTRQDVYRAVWALGLGAGFVALFAFFQKITGLALPEPWDLARRTTSIFPYPNAVGLYLAPLIALGFAAISHTIKRLRPVSSIFWATTIILSILAIIFSETEAVWVALPIVLWIMSWFSARLRRWSVPLGLITILVILAVPSINQPLFEKITLQDYSGGVRLTQWDDTIELLKDTPLLGAGLSGYPIAIVPYHQNEHIEIFQYPHNVFLNTWIELGLLGLLGLAWLSIEVLRRSWARFKNHPKQRWLIIGCLGALTVMFIHGLVDVPYFKNDLAVMTWSLLALLSVATNKYET